MDLYEFDESFRQKGYKKIAGIDEAGRGPIAGPVVASAVVLPADKRFRGLKDSKLTTDSERKRLFFEILRHCTDIGIGIAGVDAIDRYNILGATRLAMQMAVEGLSSPPDFLLIDAVRLPALGLNQQCPVKGESKSASIAAASIVAKFVRDNLMSYYHGIFPEYGFDKHKGYGTKEHLRAIQLYGPCPIHRKGFQGVMTLTLPL